MTKAEKLPMCVGCHNDFYNGKNNMGIQECFSLERAKKVERWRLGWWTPPSSVDAFTRVTTLDCHHAPGNYLDSEKLPIHLVEQGETT